MTLTITTSPPLIRVTDADGHVNLDTGKSLFHVTNTLSGTLTLPEKSPPLDSAVEYTLGSCHSDSTFVRGVMKAVYSSTIFAMFPSEAYFNAGASYVQVAYAGCIRFWTVTAAGGVVKLRDECYMHEIKNEVGQQLASLLPVPLTYYLYVGRFSP